MKGHIRERSPGHFAIVLDVGEVDPKTGKKKRKWHSFTGTKREAQKEAARLIAELDAGTYTEPTKQTVAEFLDEWLTFIKPSVAPKTHERYAEICRKGLAPLIGSVILSKLKTDRIDAAFTTALTTPRVDHRKQKDGEPPKALPPLSPRTVHHYRRVLIRALGQAVTWERLTKNPATATTPPKVERKKMLAYTVEQTAALLETLRPTRMYIPVLLAVTCGLRRGEILALRWRHVELGDNLRRLSIEQSAEQTDDGVRYKEPKSGRARTVALSASTVAELKAHRARQAEELLRLGIRPDADSFVVAQVDGSPIQPRSLTHEWVRVLGNTALPRIRFHDLRHTHATQMLSSGVHPKVASERLGHSTIGITLDLYSHVMPGMQADAAEQVDAALQAAISSERKAK
ncbi:MULTISPECIES: tyrosine-type recombinase/integrase [unclassified Mesorhizobium]|uniref:tyrosine-type recombinase/integrase n=1 Tax=unclassified Mesorhizobium TaxID=325217 RepID=UPI000F7615E3|nr:MULTISPECIES: tyrosine-type recombinase/integrase [unclassified Mesorhizobium]AZO63025.1 site-specific integrase [Mesorhizobium sp. M1A.F.Ca.IN.022.06.1.1]MCT2578593.1 site-specific integrase [Mesorhizobium sp. P13.3]MDF3167392.1 tyrosine-type recombinase/integrase [Mesorhizobium sp. P16.1]MDF3179078.1 tyrosine-type recombinase/integrase [Mesorhizobium sp. P17.1]MDF3184304.1 tyrosine-type recombinase/integrase [Mesorhizobium sp. ICCV3110.1]